jgi:hypothetical protein
MNQQERIQTRDAVLNAKDFDAEQEALSSAAVVDIRPSLPATAADLYPQFERDRDAETWSDYQAACKAVGAGWDCGARRYVIRRADAIKAKDALHAAGFTVCVHPSLLIDRPLVDHERNFEEQAVKAETAWRNARDE